VRITLGAFPIDGGARIAVGGDKPKAVEQAKNWARSLPEPSHGLPNPQEELAIEPEQDPSLGPDHPSTGRSIAEALRELTELKDAGLITIEEYETKNAELLRRM
jgi:hypothetical protein